MPPTDEVPKPRPVRVLLVSEGADPNATSGALVGWLHTRAVAKITEAHVATEKWKEQAFRDRGLTDDDFTAINSRMAQTVAFKLATWLRGGSEYNWSVYTACMTLAYPIFEHKVWKHFEARLRAGKFDVVHRVTPVTPVAPSLLAKRCARIGVPFVAGPLNGGVPWPPGFDHLQARDRDKFGKLRSLHRLLPGYKATREHSSAILIASRITLSETDSRYHNKCIYLPENAVDTEQFSVRKADPDPDVLRVAFVGRLVALKGVDMLLESALELMREGRVEIDLIGDGPEREALEIWASENKVADRVHFAGWLDHSEVPDRLRRSEVFAFPSVREFGGGAVLEAMAMGLVPVVIDYGGPGELVPEGTGHCVPLGTPDDIVGGFRNALRELASDPSRRQELGRNARRHIEGAHSWSARAGHVVRVYRWLMGEASEPEKPDFGMPLAFAGKDSAAK